MNRTKYILLLKCFYYLIPRFFREQYNDSIRFYMDLISKIKDKGMLQSHSNYIMVGDIVELTNKFSILHKETNRKSNLNVITIYQKDKGLYELEAVSENVLDINLGIFEKVSILGSTDALFYDDYLFHQELLAMEEHHDLKRHDIFTGFNSTHKHVVSLKNSKKRIYNDKNTVYISLLKEHSVNYYHWITENIPRLILIIKELKKNEDIVENKSVVLFIDEKMPKQCRDILNIIFPFKFRIEEVEKGAICECENLIYCSPLWQSLDNTSGSLNHKEFFVDKYAIELVYKSIKDHIKFDAKPAYRKIYLRRRPSQMRAIINNDNVEAYMISNGFEIVETDKMTFREQVKLFHEAKIIVGASGATFTNILFMQSSTKAIIFFPSHTSINHGIFQPLADVADINLIHYKTIPKHDESIHSNFMVDLGKINFLLGEG